MRVSPIPINASVNPRTILFAITCAAILSPCDLSAPRRPPSDRGMTWPDADERAGTSTCVSGQPCLTAGDGDGDMVAVIRAASR